MYYLLFLPNRDAVLVGMGNALTSFYSGFVIFSVLGYMAYVKGVPVKEVTASGKCRFRFKLYVDLTADKQCQVRGQHSLFFPAGPGLAFVAYPEGLALIPGAPFWSICFFFMMFTVGLDSLVSDPNAWDFLLIFL